MALVPEAEVQRRKMSGLETYFSGGNQPVGSSNWFKNVGPRPTGSVLGVLDTGSTTGVTGTNTADKPNPFENIQATGPSQQEIDEQFNPILDVLNRSESTLRGQIPSLISEAEQNAALSKRLVQDQKTSAFDLLGQQQSQTENKTSRDVADQRRLLQELTLANQQRFGGSSSAGLAASELQGREFQRSRFGIQQGAMEALQTIGLKRQEVDRTYQTGLQQIENSRQQAVNEINRRFEEKLLEIDARRGQTMADKASARMSALQELRNQAYQINVAKAQFEADLQKQAQENTSYLNQAESSILGATNQSTQATTGYQMTTPEPINSVGTQSARDTYSPTGQIQQGNLTEEDLLRGSNPFGLPTKQNAFQLGYGY